LNPVPPKVVGGAPSGELEAKWEKRAEELELEALPKVRGVAEKWAATVGVLLGLAGTILVVKGPEEIGALPSGARLLIGLLLATAFVLAVIATVLAAYAAQGTPTDLEYPTGATLREAETEATKTARTRLSRSRHFTLLAVVLLAAGVATAWIWPQEAKSGSTVLFTPNSGKPLCGSLVNTEEGLAIEANDKLVLLPAGPYDNAVAVEGCPKEKPAR
jgi:hypothetical protein